MHTWHYYVIICRYEPQSFFSDKVSFIGLPPWLNFTLVGLTYKEKSKLKMFIEWKILYTQIFLQLDTSLINTCEYSGFNFTNILREGIVLIFLRQKSTYLKCKNKEAVHETFARKNTGNILVNKLTPDYYIKHPKLL